MNGESNNESTNTGSTRRGFVGILGESANVGDVFRGQQQAGVIAIPAPAEDSGVARHRDPEPVEAISAFTSALSTRKISQNVTAPSGAICMVPVTRGTHARDRSVGWHWNAR